MPMGWASVMVTILVCSGVIMLFMGVIGEYVGRLFMTTNKNPQFLIRTRCNVSSESQIGEGASR